MFMFITISTDDRLLVDFIQILQWNYLLIFYKEVSSPNSSLYAILRIYSSYVVRFFRTIITLYILVSSDIYNPPPHPNDQ